jgi:signal transduction histidine kinase
MVYHELRSPLGLVVTAARSLAEESTDAYAKSRCEAIVRAAERMLRTANEVFALARSAEGSRPARVPLVELISSIVDDYVALGAPVMLENGGLSVSQSVFVAPEQLEALVCSLLTNACDHGAPDAPVVVRLNVFEDQCAVVVRNRLSAEKKHRGLGLGTYVCQQLAENMGASLDVSAADGHYIAFLNVPLEPAATEEAEAAA